MGTVSNINVYKNDPSPTVGEGLSTLRANQIAFRELQGALPPATVTTMGDNYSIPVSSASIILDVPNNSQVRLIRTQGNLSGVSGTAESELHDGMVIKLWGVSGKTVTLKHKGNNSVASYNIRSIDNSDIILSPTIPTVLTYDADNNIWIERERVATILSDTTGDLTNLTTTNKTNLVVAINEVKGNTSTNATNISNISSKVGTGTISNKVTNTNVVAALNDLITKIGLPLSNLTTSVKTSLVTAINSLISGTVHNTGDETINGNKTFSSAIKISKGDSPEAGALSHAFSMECKNSGGTKTHTIYPISFIGNDNTSNNYNSGVRLGSLNGTTVITSGESGSVFASALSKYDDDNLYLESDNEIRIYVKCANNMSSFAGPITISGTATNGGPGTTRITADNFIGNLSGNAATATKATQDVDGNAIKTTYAKDNAVVHTTGNETINGTKAFSTTPILLGSLNLKATYITKDVVPDATVYKTIAISDSNNVMVSGFQHSHRASGAYDLKMYVYAPGSTTSFSNIAVGYDSDGIAYGIAPSTSTTRTTGQDIVTRNFIPLDTRIVHTTDNETIGGVKTLTDVLQLSSTEPNIGQHASNLTKGTNPSSSTWFGGLYACDKTLGVSDTAYRASAVETNVDANGKTALMLRAYKWESGSNTSATIGIHYPKTGNPYTEAPTPASGDNSTKIATTAFVSSAISAVDNAVVHNTGDETINGNKTFSTTVYIKRVNPYLVFIETDIEKGVVNPSGYQGILFKDKNETGLGSILYHLHDNKVSAVRIEANNASTANATDAAAFILAVGPNGEHYASAPSTLTTRTEGTDIVTRDYVDKAFNSTAIYTTTLANTATYTSSNPWNINIANIGNYKAIIAYIKSTEATAAMNLYYKITFSDNKTKIVGVGSGINTAARYSTMYCENRYGYAYTHLQVSTSMDAYSAWYTGAKPVIIDKYATISSIDIYSTTNNVQFPSGTIITIYGVNI